MVALAGYATIEKQEKVYLTYFALGDLAAYWHGKKVRTEVSTTHRAQLTLVNNLFEKDCKPIIYPCRNGSSYCWRIVCHLNSSYSFLLNKRLKLTLEGAKDDSLFFAALSGFTDAEGHIVVRGTSATTHPVFGLSNRSVSILESFQRGLKRRGIRAAIYMVKDSQRRDHYLLNVYGSEVLKLLPKLRIRHTEKIIAATLAQRLSGQYWNYAKYVYRSFRDTIRNDRDKFVREAEIAYASRFRRKQEKDHLFQHSILLAIKMKKQGRTVEEIALASGRSPRSVYRWIKMENHQ
ncbi:MAG: helix-turn-helix domain-containing protein [Nitrososphaerota archaeon]|nr:helix-turn-helix domain-containing protein [Nitrososphaerota archaeon]